MRIVGAAGLETCLCSIHMDLELLFPQGGFSTWHGPVTVLTPIQKQQWPVTKQRLKLICTMWRTSLQRMKSSASHVRCSADKPDNRTAGRSPVWQQPLSEIRSYFRDLEPVTPHDWGFTMLSEAHCGRMLIKCHCSASTATKSWSTG